MTPDAVLSVQSTTDVELLGAPTLEPPILPLTPPSDNGTASIKDDSVSSTGQGKPANSSPTPHENKSVSTESVAVKDPIIFIDPLGTLWILPFHAAKTWEGLKAILENIFKRTSSWYYERLTSTEDDEKSSLSIVRIPQQTNILPNLWAESVEPGWRIKLRLIVEPNHAKDAPREEDKEGKQAGAFSSDSDTAGGNEETNIKEDIMYVANIYQQDGSTIPDFLGMKNLKEAVVNRIQVKPDIAQSVLCEVRNVYLGRTKYKPVALLESDALIDTDAVIDTDDIIGVCVLEIHSKPLLHALHSVLQFHTPDEEDYDHGFRVRDSICTDLQRGQFKFPYLDLYHHMNELVAYKSKMDGPRQHHSKEYNEECDRHIDVLVKYLNDIPTIAFSEAKAAWSQSVAVTTFKWLWLLLRPGSDVYVRERGCLNAYVIENVTGNFQGGTLSSRSYQVKIWNLDYDGKVFGRALKTVSVPVFDGEREIQSLPIFPVRYHRDKEGDAPLRDVLVKRGKKFVEVIKEPTYQEYTGPSSFSIARTFNQARVIVDHTRRPWEFETLRGLENSHIPRIDDDDNLGQNIRVAACPCTICTESSGGSEPLYRRVIFDDYDDISLESEQGLTDHQYSLCFSQVYAYALQDRLWDLVDVKGLRDPGIDEKVIDTLVMRPESNKSMIKAICETYAIKEDRETLFYADYIKGKGEGQIVLLHGPPGTGKTLTAESVAEYTRRPLLSITAADLGQEPHTVGANLLQFFRDASKWDAIVLLDEADVYLERRSTNELRRNSIVSILLRQLDYFQGIFFITTNRVGCFDEAFMSRIYIQIAYDPLDEEARQQIWKNSFAKLEANTEHGGREILVSISAKEYVKDSKSLRSLQWNGREIKNAFQTAATLAAFDAKQKGNKTPKITEDHFTQIVGMSSAFKKYMHSTLRDNDADNAYHARLRDDTFKLVPMSMPDRDV